MTRGNQNKGLDEAQAIEGFIAAINSISNANLGWRNADHGIKESFDALKFAFFQGDKRALQDPSYVRECAFVGCGVRGKGPTGEELVSANSHVIANAASITPLASESPRPHLKVLQPDLNDVSNPKMRKVSPTEASTFIGYCRTHEDFYQVFEKQKKLTKAEHYMLQLTRSAAREVWKKEVFQESLDRIRETYKEAVDLLHISQQDKDDWNRKIQDPLDALWFHAQGQKIRLHQIHLDLTASIKAPELPEWVSQIEYDSTLKVALSGSTFLDHLPSIGPGAPSAPMLVITLVPNGDKTLLLMASSKDDARWVKLYEAQFLQTPARRDCTILAWMTATDHWFANPEWWNHELSEQSRKDILKRLSTV